MNRLSLFALVLISSYGCGSSVPPSPDSNLVQFDEDDEEMNAAIDKGKATFDFFKENWLTLENDGYSVKFGLETSTDDLEYIWFNPITIKDEMIVAECANDPVDIPGLKLGDVRELSEEKVVDWMIMSGKKCYGGYTMKVMMQNSTPPPGVPQFEFIDVSKN